MQLTPDDVAAIWGQLRPELERAMRDVLESAESPIKGRLALAEVEVAELLGLEQHHVREQRRRGRIKYFRGPGKRIMYRPADVLAYIASRSVESTST